MAESAASSAEARNGEARDPLESEPWFRELPAERRAEFSAMRRAQQERGAELESAERRRALAETGKMAVVLALGDLLAPGRDAESLVLALGLGGGLGFTLARLDAGRLSSGAVGLATFIALEWASRGGMSALHMLLFFPMGCACAYLGWLREERQAG
jgi:hypothetical protein